MHQISPVIPIKWREYIHWALSPPLFHSLCLSPTIKSFFCSLLLHKNQCSQFSAVLGALFPLFYLHSSIISSSLPTPFPTLSVSHIASPFLLLPFSLPVMHLAHDDGSQMGLTDHRCRRISPSVASSSDFTVEHCRTPPSLQPEGGADAVT